MRPWPIVLTVLGLFIAITIGAVLFVQTESEQGVHGGLAPLGEESDR